MPPALPPRQHPLLALEQLAPQCAELQELRPLCERARARLTSLAAHLDAAERPDDPRLNALIARLAGFVERDARSNAVRRFTDVNRLRELYELQLALDAAFRASNAAHADAARDWQVQWQRDADFAEQQLQGAVLDRELLRYELQDSADQQREALALVKFAAENLALLDDQEDEQGEYRATRARLLKQVFRLLLSVVDVEVPVIPEWFISPNDVAPHKRSFSSDAGSEVHVAEWLPLTKTVIVKQLSRKQQQQKQEERAAMREALLREAEVWYPLNHPNVLKLVGGCHVSTPLFLVYESPEDESQTLDALLSESSEAGGRLQSKVFHVLFQVALALQYLHEQHRLVHNGLKCRNILVSADGKAKLCSFGDTMDQAAGKTTTADNVRALNASGSLRWTSPESLRHGRVGLASDIYAFGMCILEAVTGGDVPWGFADDQTIRARVAAGELPERDERVDNETWRLIASMCSLDPDARPSIAAVVESLSALAERERQQRRFDSGRASRVVGTDILSRTSEGGLPADYDNYRRQLTHSRRGSMSDTRSVSSGTSSGVSKSEQQPPPPADTVSIVTLQQKWLGIKINSIGTKIVVSKFLRSASGAMGEIEASGNVKLGDIIYAVNSQTVRGMDRHKIGAFIQSTPRPLNLSFKRERGLLDECFRFNGLRLEERWRDRGSALPLPGSLDRLFSSPSGAFSLELWFSLADASDSFLGGILLGAQDIAVEDASWPYIHKQLVIVDQQGNLCCSLLHGETPVLIARELTPSIWYHLVVTYDSTERQLTVYLDGELRHSSTGPLLRDWQRLGYANVGSGCISGISPAKPTPEFTGWYGFNGLVHDLKIWRALLSGVEVQQLFRGASDCVDIPSYSMRRDFRKKASMQSAQFPERVRASRPQHVVAQVY